MKFSNNIDTIAFKILNKILVDTFRFVGSMIPLYFELVVTSPLGFKARVGSIIHTC